MPSRRPHCFQCMEHMPRARIGRSQPGSWHVLPDASRLAFAPQALVQYICWMVVVGVKGSPHCGHTLPALARASAAARDLRAVAAWILQVSEQYLPGRPCGRGWNCVPQCSHGLGGRVMGSVVPYLWFRK